MSRIASLWCLSVIFLFLGFFATWGWFIFRLFLRFGLGLACFLLGMLIVANSGPFRRRSLPRLAANPVTEMIAKRAMSGSGRADTRRSTVLSRALDRAIQEVLENTVRDYVMSWYKKTGEDEPGFKAVVMDEAWVIVQKAVKRLKSVDMLKFLTEDLLLRLTVHFHDLKNSGSFGSGAFHAGYQQQQQQPTSKGLGFQMHPCVDSPASEVEFLRTASEVLLSVLLPEADSYCTSMRLVLREVLACQVLLPTIETLCDPDYINQTLLAHLDYKEQLTQKDSANYATFEQFVKKIKTCAKIEDLKQIRYHILAEIMQATIIQNLKQAKGMGAEDRDTLVGHIKSELLRNRDLKRYLNQCQYAKKLCEQRIQGLGGPGYVTDRVGVELPRSIGRISFAELMTDDKGRDYLLDFMLKKKKRKSGLLRFWMTAEELKGVAKDDEQCRNYVWRSLHKVYLSPDAPEPVELKSGTMRDIEEFLVGQKGREVLTTAQDEAYDLIEECAYRDFLSSELYCRYMFEQRPLETRNATDSQPGGSVSPTWEDPYGEEEEDDILLGTGEEDEASTVHRQKLESLKGRLRKKVSVLDTLKSRMTASPDIAQLEEEVNLLRSEIRELEFHMERTQEYVSTLGKWKTQIQRVDVDESHKGHPTLLYTIIVHRDLEMEEDEELPPTGPGASGWIVVRNLKDFEKLHRNLKECSPSLGKELPLPSVGFFGSRDKVYQQKSRQMLEQYIQGLLADEKVCSSEELYQFLIPSPEYLRKGSSKAPTPKKFFLAEAIKSIPFVGDLVETIAKMSNDAEEEDEIDGRDGKDSIAEPMYGFVKEAFELRGIFKWLRRQLIVFIQITFGRSMNKQMRETVKWLTSEEMVLYYIHTFRDSMWPNGKLAPARPVRTDEEKAVTKIAAKERLMKNIPAVLQSFLGQKSSRLGVSKMFDAFQDSRANKHLVYVLLELLIFNLVPEVKSAKVKQRLAAQKRQQTAA